MSEQVLSNRAHHQVLHSSTAVSAQDGKINLVLAHKVIQFVGWNSGSNHHGCRKPGQVCRFEKVFHFGLGMKLVPVLQSCGGFRADHSVCDGSTDVHYKLSRPATMRD